MTLGITIRGTMVAIGDIVLIVGMVDGMVIMVGMTLGTMAMDGVLDGIIITIHPIITIITLLRVEECPTADSMAAEDIRLAVPLLVTASFDLQTQVAECAPAQTTTPGETDILRHQPLVIIRHPLLRVETHLHRAVVYPPMVHLQAGLPVPVPLVEAIAAVAAVGSPVEVAAVAEASLAVVAVEAAADANC